jgi:hypothetical protein
MASKCQKGALVECQDRDWMDAAAALVLTKLATTPENYRKTAAPANSISSSS